MRYVPLKSKGIYLVRDLMNFAIVARRRTYGEALAEAKRLNVAYSQLLNSLIQDRSVNAA